MQAAVAVCIFVLYIVVYAQKQYGKIVHQFPKKPFADTPLLVFDLFGIIVYNSIDMYFTKSN